MTAWTIAKGLMIWSLAPFAFVLACALLLTIVVLAVNGVEAVRMAWWRRRNRRGGKQ